MGFAQLLAQRRQQRRIARDLTLRAHHVDACNRAVFERGADESQVVAVLIEDGLDGRNLRAQGGDGDGLHDRLPAHREQCGVELLVRRLGLRLLLLDRPCNPAREIHGVAHGRADGKISEGRQVEAAAEQFRAIFLAPGARRQAHLGIAQSRLGERQLLGLGERLHGGLHGAIVLERLLDDAVDRIRPEQRPPIALDRLAERDMLQSVGGTAFGGDLVRGVARRLGRLGPHEVRPDVTCRERGQHAQQSAAGGPCAVNHERSARHAAHSTTTGSLL